VIVDQSDTAIMPHETDNLYHYTTADVAIFNILDQGALRLSSYESTNDPEESHPKNPTLSGSSESGEATKIWAEADRWLRRYVKVACFTRDFELDSYSYARDETASRGWAHPALWAHYGGRYGGVCLQFDRERLVKQFIGQMSSRGQCFHGAVEYPEQRLGTTPSDLDIPQIREFGVDAVVSFYIDKYHRELFFTKHHDWASEFEFRLILNEPSPLPAYLDIAECLTGVILGESFPTSMLDAVRHLLRKSPAIELRRLNWLNGIMLAGTIKLGTEERSVSPRRMGSFEERFQELRSLEIQRAEAHARGERLTEGLVSALSDAISSVQSLCSTWPHVKVKLFPQARAVPHGQHARRAGVPGEEVEFQRGFTCYVNNDSDEYHTLAIAAAIQVLEGEIIRLYGSMTLRIRLPSGNQNVEVWAKAFESSVDNAPTVANRLVEEMNAEMLRAKREFEATRSTG
jgi:Protein of unknown function (DUF2971)